MWHSRSRLGGGRIAQLIFPDGDRIPGSGVAAGPAPAAASAEAEITTRTTPRGRTSGLNYPASMTLDWDWTRVVFDHVKIGVRDAAASLRFYKAVLVEPLGIPPLWEEAGRGAQFANLVVVADAAPGGP